MVLLFLLGLVWRCHVSYVTGGSNWYWLRVGQGLQIAGKGSGEMFLFLQILHFHSCSSFFPVPLFHLLYYLTISFLPFSGRWHKMTHKGLCVLKPQHNQFYFFCFFSFISCFLFFPVPPFHLLYSSISFFHFSERWHKMTHNGWRVCR